MHSGRGPIYTIGHSTHPIEEFIGLLRHYEIAELVDIRTIPKSRHNPQYSQETLRESLASAGIAYRHMKSLGGLRPTTKDSINGAWRNKSFRGYADYMQTAEFGDAVEELIALGTQNRVAIMCAEAVPWRCHRSLVGDALLVRGVQAIDIMSMTQSKAHALTRFAEVDGTRVTYPADSASS